jgi:DNA (cytosine-5)-methyltransferase 1
MIARKKVIDICCGAGGLSYGFASHKRFELLGGIDNDQKAILAYRKNFRKSKGIVADVAKINGEFIKKELGNPDVVACGFPCQVYSSIGSGDVEDKRLDVMYECLRLIGEIGPEMVLLENVVGLISFDQGRVLKRILMFLENLGFVVNYEIVDAVDFGVPQNRKRIVMVATRNTKFKFSRRYKKTFWTVKDAWSDLNGGPTNEFLRWIKKGSKKVVDHDVLIHSNTALEKIDKDFGFANSYKRLEWSKPAKTVVSSFGFLSGPSSVHPDANRALSVREAARLQSFPDKFRFFGSKSDKRKQVANAVPPLLSIAIARMMWRHFKNERETKIYNTVGVFAD